MAGKLMVSLITGPGMAGYFLLKRSARPSPLLLSKLWELACAQTRVQAGEGLCYDCPLQKKKKNVFRGQNINPLLDMTKCNCSLFGHKFSQFQILSGHFMKKKLKIIQLLLRFQGNLSTN